MGCNSCKNKNNVDYSGVKINRSIIVNLIFFIFSIGLLSLIIPIIFLGGIYLLFNTIVLNKDTNLIPSLTFISDLIYNKDKKEEETEFELSDSEFELMDVEEVGKNG